MRILPLVTAGLLAVSLQAQSVSTVPVGAMTVTIAGSPNGSAYTLTQFSAPLLKEPLVLVGEELGPITGLSMGRITAVGSNTISVSNAGWISGQLAQPGLPLFLHVTSGENEGRMFQILSNTETAVTVNSQGMDLAASSFSVGLEAGDRYEIVAGDTLLGILGTPADGVVGGLISDFSANTIDKVIVNDPSNNAVLVYYYNNQNLRWQRAGSNSDQNNLVISPRAGIEYQRISTEPLAITFLGGVPQAPIRHQIASLGTTLIARYFPVDTTLGELGLDSIPGWRKVGDVGITTANCDRVFIKNGAALLTYYYDATASGWRRLGSGAPQDNVVVVSGASVRVARAGLIGNSDTWFQALPYELN